MQEIKELDDLTLNEVISIDKAIKRVRDKNLQTGGTIPGCTFPFKIMYKNGKIEGQIENRVKAFNDAKNKRIEKLQIDKETGELDKKGKPVLGEDGNPIKGKWLSPANSKKIEKELEKEVLEIEKDLVLQPYRLSWFLEMEDDEYYREANKGTPVPQEFFSLMGRMIFEDNNGEEKKPEKKK